MNCNIRSMYLCVEDMDRAILFYEDLFEQPVTSRDHIYSVFDIQGFRLGLFAYHLMNEEHIYGSNCLPSLEFDNLDILQDKISSKTIAFPLTQIKDNWICEIADSEGNHIELTAPVRAIL